MGKYNLVSVDATKHYCSGKQACTHCLAKNHRNGKQSFRHQMLAALAVHLHEASVFPVACEAIVNEDGYTKNDCELNASKRLLPQIRATFGTDEPILVLCDALYNNGFHVKALKEQNMNYIIATKGKSFVDIQIHTLKQQQDLDTILNIVMNMEKKYLATNFAILTLLAFLTDQIALKLDEGFKKAKLVCKSFKALCERIRMIAYFLQCQSMGVSIYYR